MKKTTELFDISIILPTYNEKENILIILKRICNILEGESFQIIVVDDNSPDGTWEIARQFAPGQQNIQVIRRLNEKGLSSAIMAGFRSSNSRWMVVMDADLQHDEQILRNFLSAFRNGYDIVIGTRKSAGGSIENWNMLRRMLSWTATKMAFLIIKNNVSDPMSGYFGISREVLNKSINKINPRGFKILLEILARNPGSKIFEIGYTFHNRLYGKSKLSTHVIIQYLAALYELTPGRHVPVRFIKYCMVGFTGLLIFTSVEFIVNSYLKILSDYAVILGTELAMINNYFLNNTWTFKEFRHRRFHIFSGLLLFHILCIAGLIAHHYTKNFLVDQMTVILPVADFMGLVLASVWNYNVNFAITWKKRNINL